MGITESQEILNVELSPEDVFQQLVDYFGDKYIKHKVQFSHIEGRWRGGSLKIEIVPSNGKSQVKLNFSALYMILLLVAIFIIGDVASLILLSRNFFFLIREIPTSAFFGFMAGRWWKRTTMRRVKELFESI